VKNVLGYFTAKAAQLPTGESSRLQTIVISGGDRYGVQFTSGGSQQAIWTIPKIPEAYQGGTIKLDVDCIMASATSGNVVLTGAVEAITPADALNLNTTNSFDTANSSGAVTVAGSAGNLFVATITLTLNDSAAAGDYYRVKLIRTTDTATGDLIILGATLYEDRTDTKGDLYVATSNTAIANVPVGTDGLVLTADSAQAAGVKWGSPMVSTTPTIQTFTSGSGTYTTPANCVYIRVRMVGGGGGGAGSGATNATDGGTGGNTTFGSSLLVANGGAGGSDVIASYGGAGGTASLGTGPIGVASTGGPGGGNNGAGVIGGPYSLGGHGASTPFGGGGGCAANGIGQAGTTNTGSGGGGGSPANGQANVFSGSGGGAGGYVDAMIINPSATYSYAVGTGGTAGAAGTNGNAGGAGGSGYIVVEQYFAVATLPYVAPTIQAFTSGSGTYTTPSNCLYIRVRAVGGGGGGAGSGSASSGAGGAGGNTTFGTLAANGGGGGYTALSVGDGGVGGTASLGSGPIGVAIPGNSGSAIMTGTANSSSPCGAGSPLFGGGGKGRYGVQPGSGETNSGGGGAGASAATTGSNFSGGSGGSGGCVDAIIISPSATYSYAVGTAGTAGTAGTNGYAGGAGGSGYIIVEQYFAPASAQAYVTPTVTKLTTGSGTYNTPAGCAFIKVKMVGAGGGGSGSGTTGQGSGGAGGNTTFGSSLLVANGGSGGLNTTAGGAGGTASLGTGPIGVTVTGTTGAGTPAVSYGTYGMGGGRGGDAPFFNGSGNPVYQAAGGSGVTNTGGGGTGGGAGSTSTSVGGSGGGSGGFIEAIITTPAASYSYSIGTAGTAGTAGTSGFAGGAGGSGYIVVEEYCTQASGTYATLTGTETFTNKRISYQAGTTTANTAPIKLLSGTNMTTPESGAIEFDGTDLYITNSTPTRNKVGIKKAPTIQKFTSGSGTYTTPSGCVWIRVRMVGGGAGGVGSGTGAGSVPTAGGNSTFGSSLLTCNGGAISTWASTVGGAGGSASLGTGPLGLAFTGANGDCAMQTSTSTVYAKAGRGGNSVFGGEGYGGGPVTAGQAAAANTGSGGGGGGGQSSGSTVNAGAGGGAGGYVDAIISSPSATYAYAVGAAGNAGGAGTGGYAGGAGAAGIIIVEEYYS